MNKILPYIVIAILLGAVTMVVPYALLGPSYNTAMTEGNTLIQPSPEPEQPSASTEPPTSEPTEPSTGTETSDNQERAFTEGGDVESSDTPSPVPEVPLEPEESSEPVTQESQPGAPESALTETNLIGESLPVLSPIVLMTIPSFLIALGAFIYLRKRWA
jgi:outer membrane biosynthesis protein TonB